MPQNDFSISNASGAAVRADINSALQALATISSGSSAPSTTYAYQIWLDSSSATAPVIKQRNSGNTDWIEIATLDANGNVSLAGTGALDIPVGTTAQRPTASQGHLRYNTTTSSFEGYDGSAWGNIGGGATGAGGDEIFHLNGQTVTTNYTLAATKNAVSAGPITIASGVSVTQESGSNWVIV